MNFDHNNVTLVSFESCLTWFSLGGGMLLEDFEILTSSITYLSRLGYDHQYVY
jgi:hypothetical protein